MNQLIEKIKYFYEDHKSMVIIIIIVLAVLGAYGVYEATKSTGDMVVCEECGKHAEGVTYLDRAGKERNYCNECWKNLGK